MTTHDLKELQKDLQRVIGLLSDAPTGSDTPDSVQQAMDQAYDLLDRAESELAEHISYLGDADHSTHVGRGC